MKILYGKFENIIGYHRVNKPKMALSRAESHLDICIQL